MQFFVHSYFDFLLKFNEVATTSTLKVLMMPPQLPSCKASWYFSHHPFPK